jgi:hypothetical protein
MNSIIAIPMLKSRVFRMLLRDRDYACIWQELEYYVPAKKNYFFQVSQQVPLICTF